MITGRKNIRLSRRGIRTVIDRVMPMLPNSRTGDTGQNSRTPGPNDLLTEAWLSLPPVAEVAHEVEGMRLAGKLEPFHEGQKVGVLPRRVRGANNRRPTAAEVERARNVRKEDQRSEMLALRRKNDRDLERLAQIGVLYGR